MNIRGADFVYYQTGDLDKAIAFYRDTLQLELIGHFEDVKWAEFAVGNVTLTLNDPSSFDANAKAQTGGAAISLAVENVDEAMAELQEKGVTVTFPAQETPVCHVACIADPDGNNIWIHQRKDGTFGD